MNIAYPYSFDGRGRTAQADDDDHIRQMIEEVLFTAPGERVNRPDFGCGLLQMVFAPNSSEVAKWPPRRNFWCRERYSRP
jgi:phage baseplate assembly protein W